MIRNHRRHGGISLALVVSLVSIVFLGLAATSMFRRSVSRQLQTLLHSLQIIDVAEAAISEVAQRELLDEVFQDPAKLAQLRQAFVTGTYRGGVLFPPGSLPDDSRTPVTVEIEPKAIKARLAADPRIQVGNVRLMPLQYRPTKARQVGLMRFIVAVNLTEGDRQFSKKVAADYEYSVFKDAGTNQLRFLLSKAPKAKVYP